MVTTLGKLLVLLGVSQQMLAVLGGFISTRDHLNDVVLSLEGLGSLAIGMFLVSYARGR